MNQNQFAFGEFFKAADFFKNADLFKNTFDFNQAFSTQRRNLEAFSSANQMMAEGAQAVSRAGAEALRSNVEAMIKSSKDMMSGGTPDVSKQADMVRSMFENNLANMREMTEMATKCGFEAFQMLNERATESMSELGAQAAPRKKK